MTKPVLEIKNLNVQYKTKGTVFNKEKVVNAVNDLNLSVEKGEIIAVAGESGCGKSTLASAICRLIPVASGEILFHGVDILKLKGKKLKVYRQALQIIFQNPYSSLNPKKKVFDILKEQGKCIIIVTHSKTENCNCKSLDDEAGVYYCGRTCKCFRR